MTACINVTVILRFELQHNGQVWLKGSSIDMQDVSQVRVRQPCSGTALIKFITENVFSYKYIDPNKLSNFSFLFYVQAIHY